MGTPFAVLGNIRISPSFGSPRGRYLVVGPDRHGVVAHAIRLAAADPRLQSSLVRVPVSASGVRPPGFPSSIPPGGAAMVHVTDRLFGASPEEAAEVVDQLAGRARLALALHDIPQPAEGSQWYARRSRAYAAMGQAARVVVVASEHERKALGRCLDDATGSPSCDSRVVVVPLPIEQGAEERTHPPRRDVGTAEVGILGYLYPGKGVEDVLAAVTVLRREALDVRVTCLGAPAEGHADYADELARRATDAQVPFRITGYLPDAELPSRLRAVDVPVASHRHISASGSMNTWLEAGRRPVTLPSPYARELTARIPGALEITEDLVAGVREALDHPEGTWLNSDVALGPSVAEVARQHADLLDALRNTLDAAGAPVERTPAR